MLPLRHIAPSGTPIRLSALLAAGLDQLSGRDTDTALTQTLAARYGVSHCLTLSSGRAALALIFRTLADLNVDPRRNEIIVPGYTCYSVAAAAILAGLRLRVVDIDPESLSYDRTRLDGADTSRALAIVSANLYGLPNDLEYLEGFARSRGIYMVDDAAQALHATCNGRPAGTFGDVGIYSFDKGKNITSLQGGAIVTRDPAIAAALAAAIDRLPDEAAAATVVSAVKLAAYSVLLRPWLYWIPANIPALGLGRTVYTTDMPMHRLSGFASGLVLRLFERIDAITADRVRNAGRIREALAGTRHLRPIAPLPGTGPVYLRLPCLAASAAGRDALIQVLNRAGIGATGSFPQSLADLAELGPDVVIDGETLDGARSVASRIITLPTLAYMQRDDITRLARTAAAGSQG